MRASEIKSLEILYINYRGLLVSSAPQPHEASSRRILLATTLAASTPLVLIRQRIYARSRVPVGTAGLISFSVCGRFLPAARSGSAESRTAGCIDAAIDDRFFRASAESRVRL